MTIRLRPHHLLCVLTFVGRGYSEAFVRNYDAVAERLSNGEDVLVVEGPDDICRPVEHDSDTHCHKGSVVERDTRAAEDVGRLLSKPIAIGARLALDRETLERLRSAFAAGTVRSACRDCPWSTLCDRVADDGYAAARVSARAPC